MIRMGTVLGYQTYSYRPEGSNKRYEGLRVSIAYRPMSEDGTEVAGQMADTVSISFANLGSYAPAVGDEVRYHLYRENGRQKCGFIQPL